jgi:hypothetical protein
MRRTVSNGPQVGVDSVLLLFPVEDFYRTGRLMDPGKGMGARNMDYSMPDDANRCRVCGYGASEPPWGADGTSPTFEYCPCCGVEHGYQDTIPAGARLHRRRWIAAGGAWDDPGERPAGWILEDQLTFIPADFL